MTVKKIKLKTITQMTRKDFENVPMRERFSDSISNFDCLIILPQRRLHDSGFRCMDFVAVKGNYSICRLSGCSDVIHIDGIGGYGHLWFETFNKIPDKIKPHGWSIDCLRVSGLLRIFCNGKILAGAALSSFEIYRVEKPKEGCDVK